MGLIKAVLGAAGGVMADQWKEYFYCEAMENGVLVSKGRKRTSRRSSNRYGEENVISNGSVVAVNEGQCMMIVEQGRIVEFSAEPGEYIWNSFTEPSIFAGNFEDGLQGAWDTFVRRFSMGADTGRDQRVYYFNIKEIMGNKYGTPNPVPFRVIDKNIGLDMDIAVRCFGEYSYWLSNPILFYKNVCGNVENVYTVKDMESQLKSELLTALQPAFAKLSEMGIRYSSLPGHALELAEALKEILSEKWDGKRGITILSIGVNSIKASEEDENYIKELQRAAVLTNPAMAAAQLTHAQAEALKAAANNPKAGPAMAFMGMNMAQAAGGMDAQALFEMVQEQKSEQKSVTTAWTCRCGASGNTGKFCVECGSPKPVEKTGWVCTCGAVNQGKFCSECGTRKPASELQYRCDKCGWEPKDPTKPPKFCPRCGDAFDNGDAVS